MASWELAAVIIAILAYPFQVLAVPHLSVPVQQWFSWLFRRLWPPSATCTTFHFSDFPGGFVHVQGPGQPTCREAACADPLKAYAKLRSADWNESLSLLFPVAWGSVGHGRCKKPAQLRAHKTYIRTDAETLLLLWCTMKLGCKLKDGAEWGPLETIEFQEQDGILTAKRVLKWALPVGWNLIHAKLCELDKATLQGLFFDSVPAKGTTIELNNGCKIAHPVKHQSHLRRAGWVVAAGMSVARDYKPRPYPYGSIGFYPIMGPILRYDGRVYARFFLDQKSSVPKVDAALYCVLFTLEHILLPEFLNGLENQYLLSAIDTVKKIQQGGLIVGEDDYDQDAMLSHYRYAVIKWSEEVPIFRDFGAVRYNAAHLKGVEQQVCETVVDVFNEKTRLTVAQRDTLKPIMLSVCRAAVAGVLTVGSFYKYPIRYILEPGIMTKHRFIYLENERDLEEDNWQ